MAQAFILNMYATDNSHIGQRKFSGLPIRVGRNALNDWQVGQSFVSDFHARIEEVDGQLAVRDLNSKNGVYVRPDPQSVPVRLAPQVPVPLRPHGYEFFVGPLLRIHVQAIAAGHSETMRDLKAHGSVLGNQQMMEPAAEVNVNAQRAPSAPPFAGASAPGASAPPYPYPYPTPLPPARVGSIPAQRGPTPVPPPPGAALPPVPRISAAPTPAPVAATLGSGEAAKPAERISGEGQVASVVRGTSHFVMSPESLALIGLRELATSLVPGLPLETTGDIARLITKLHDTVEAFCRCFVPLREGHAKFAASDDLERASSERSHNRSSAYLAVEHAQDPAAVAKALLNWRDPSLDAPSAVEGICADLVVHQAALLEGVMNGVRALLDELSPENVERMQAERRPVGVHLALGRYKALWETYAHLHDMLEQQQEGFVRMFGAEFAAAYQERKQRRPESTSTR